MCGIVAVLAPPGRFQESDIARATDSLSHRGPDAFGIQKVWTDSCWEVWFGHRRLSIVDLSNAGAQPLQKRLPDGRSGTIIFNGEIYNHVQLRQGLSSRIEFTSSSDTEVLLAGFLDEGPGFLSKCNSMAAGAIFENSSRRITLFRDRLGKKPLFIYQGDNVLAFASELKAFRALGLPLTEDPEGWAYFHWLRHIPGENSIYREVRKFRAASFATVELSGAEPLTLRYQQFWDPFGGCHQTFAGNYDEAVDGFLALLDDATKLRVEADVPVGVFLSAGIDSSLVASSVAKVASSRITAFIVQAESPDHDESPEALDTARQLGLPAKVLDLRRIDYEQQIGKAVFHYDEPCAPLSQIPTMAISQLASRHVKVVLTGDGGDELFLGYPWFRYPERIWPLRRAVDRLPGLNRFLQAVLESGVAKPLLYLISVLSGANPKTTASKRMLALELLRASGAAQFYECFQENWPRFGLGQPDRFLLGDRALVDRLSEWFDNYSWDRARLRSLAEYCAMQEMVGPMRDEILVKVDRATMAYSVEARCPLLDYRMVEFALGLPLEFKSDQGIHKRLLRSACERRLGARLAARKKSGFGIPAPSDMPEGPTEAVRWSREFERRWRAYWTVEVLPPKLYL